MATKSKITFLCEQCGEDFPRWAGKCAACGAWNSLVEHKTGDSSGGGQRSGRSAFRAAGAGQFASQPIALNKIELAPESRVQTDIEEFDRIMGGGIVAGSVSLIGGEPGIGKSTLLLQVALRMGKKGAPALYVSGEESLEQMRLRAARMGAVSKHIFCLSETEVTAITNHIESTRPSCVIVDSIQTTYSNETAGVPGSLSQLRDSAAQLLYAAKQLRVPVFLVGHLTKSGVVAGPRILEHMVDTVLYFEGDRHHNFRILRAVKNRFGSTNEIGIFEMAADGLKEVSNPSQLFLQERPSGASGSVVVPALEGTRPLLVEIQALTAPNGGFGAPRRSTTGVDSRRMALLIAVMEKRVGIRMFDQDIYVNIAGGVKVEEPAADLAALCAMASSYRGVPVGEDTVIIGEVGLAGEIRNVSHLERRLTESARLGFRKAVASANHRLKAIPGIQLYGAKNVGDALRYLEIQ
jgi:DNA repair protein RadA/Sms